MDVHTNGHSTSASSADADLDLLYAFWPGMAPGREPCPEARFSCTIKGQVGGHDTLVTVRGMTSEEFLRNLESIKGLLDPVLASPVPQADGAPQCPTHGAMKQGRRGWFCPRKNADETWCTSWAQ